jgi:tetratricopeptide (TPR) repeat protein
MELRSSHFVLLTDLEQAEAQRISAELERLYDLLAAAILPHQQAPRFETRAVVFKNAEDWMEFSSGYAGGLFRSRLPDDVDPLPTLMSRGAISRELRTTLAHELTHRMCRVALGRHSTWLGEGLAQYYSTIAGEPKKPIVGETDPLVAASGSIRGTPNSVISRGELIGAGDLPRASELITKSASAFYSGGFERGVAPSFEQLRAVRNNYAASWALVHMLMHSGSDYAARFRAILGAPQGREKKGGELEGLVASVDKARLDADLLGYLGGHIPWHQRFDDPAPPLSELGVRKLTEPQILVLWARLEGFQGARAKEHLARAYDAYPREPDVLLWTGRYLAAHGDFIQAERRFQAALALESDRGDVLLALSYLYRDPKNNWAPGVREAGLRRTLDALERVAKTGRELNAVALDRLFNSDSQGALAPSARACQAAIDCWDCCHTAAAAAYASGSLARALELELEAASRISEYEPAEAARLVDETLGRFKAELGGAPASRSLPKLFIPD